ncbi:hypothetical protein [Actinoplanes sp. DH11]|uniref:hypothetical protein n=1 Tax=Actinoplanes sp. DH11 TaxID=2857011 RepID=UPI001E44795A|nr:hypothetical protein [Actinoplanes sp. DH11]
MRDHTPSTVSRRTVLRATGLGAAAAAGLGLGSTLSASPAAAASSLSRVDAAFIRRGLVHCAWVAQATDGRWQPTPQRFRDSGFTTPTFYDPPLWDAALMAGLPGYTWAAAKGPAGVHLTPSTPPDLTRPVLSAAQRARAGDLFSMCFGDEENYSQQLLDWLVPLTAKLRQEAPNALMHTNQYAGQWNDTQMKNFMAVVRPDLLTFDEYYFSMSSNHVGGSITNLYNNTARYRWLALGGNDQSFTNPIAFGQYTMGFRSGNAPSQEGGNRVVSESEQSVVSYVTWALGGKWLNLFRWEKDAHPTSLLVRKDAGSGPTRQAQRYTTLNARMKAFSPYLSRLRSHKAFLVMGRNSGGYNTQPWLDVFAPGLDPQTRLSAIAAANVGGANGGLPGDILVGTFRPIPGMTAEESAGIFTNPGTPAFMVVNALALPNADRTDEYGTGGSSADTAQNVTLTFDLSDGSVRPDQLRMLNAATGQVVSPVLTARGNGRYELVKFMGGGTGELFWWQLG